MLYWQHSCDLGRKLVGKEKNNTLSYERERNTKELCKSPLQPKELQVAETQVRLI